MSEAFPWGTAYGDRAGIQPGRDTIEQRDRRLAEHYARGSMRLREAMFREVRV